MAILKGTENTLLGSRFGYGKRTSTRAKSVNSENRHRHASRLSGWSGGGKVSERADAVEAGGIIRPLGIAEIERIRSEGVGC